jgi:hypothetical protein
MSAEEQTDESKHKQKKDCISPIVSIHPRSQSPLTSEYNIGEPLAGEA